MGLLLIVVEFCRWLKRETECLDFVIAYNWWQVLQTVAVLLVTLVGSFLPSEPALVIAFIVQIAILANEWFIARITIKAGGLVATVVVLLDLVATAVTEKVAQSLF
jgi:hypothetical protein